MGYAFGTGNEMKNGLMMAMAALLATVAHAQELKPLPNMTSAKVLTARDAEAIVTKHIMATPNDGISATETIVGKLSFALGYDISGFGRQGDRVWQVHRVSFAETTSVIWVNAENKAVHVVSPVKHRDAEQQGGGYSPPAARSSKPRS